MMIKYHTNSANNSSFIIFKINAHMIKPFFDSFVYFSAACRVRGLQDYCKQRGMYAGYVRVGVQARLSFFSLLYGTPANISRKPATGGMASQLLLGISLDLPGIISNINFKINSVGLQW